MAKAEVTMGMLAWMLMLLIHGVRPQGSVLWWPHWVDRFYQAMSAWLGLNFWYRQELPHIQWFADLRNQVNFTNVFEVMLSFGPYGQEIFRIMVF